MPGGAGTFVGANAANGQPFLPHAKSALADPCLGYVGSASMTRQGLGDRLQIGIRLPNVEAGHLVTPLERVFAAQILQQHGP
jgi:hypothetical protein